MSEVLVADAHLSDAPIAPNAKRLLLAGFMAILVAGVGFSIRSSVFDALRGSYAFSDTQLGNINGAGMTGFCFGIIIAGLLADKIGYGPLVGVAFASHLLSAVITLIVPNTAPTHTAYQYLFWGSFIFAVANGTLEGVANPLVATLFPHNRTHYLNVLHASWPAGLILGNLVCYFLGTRLNYPWKVQLGLFMVPVIGYGLLFLGQKTPKSEAAEKGLKFSQMFRDVGILGALVACALLAVFFGQNVFVPLAGMLHISAQTAIYIGYAIGAALVLIVAIMTDFSVGSWLLFILIILHGLVGTVELGTDGWIPNTGNSLFGNVTSHMIPSGLILFTYSSLLMFILRFGGHFIEKKIGLSPVGILLCAAVLACVGLNLLSLSPTIWVALGALTVYALGKAFFWPTMLAVASDRFPKTGAIAISIMGGVGMLAAGLLGGPGLGYANDRFAGQNLPAQYEQYRANEPSKFLGKGDAYGINPTMLAVAQKAVAEGNATPGQLAAVHAYQAGNRQTLRADSAIPATMAIIFLCLFIYFRSIGGYKAVHLAGTHGDEHVSPAASVT